LNFNRWANSKKVKVDVGNGESVSADSDGQGGYRIRFETQTIGTIRVHHGGAGGSARYYVAKVLGVELAGQRRLAETLQIAFGEYRRLSA